MKSLAKLSSILLTLGLPLTAQAYCDRYPNSTLTLNLPATITVPDSLPIGGVITTQAFTGSAPSFIATCTAVVHRKYNGRYPDDRYPGSLVYKTEVPGVGLRIQMTWADGTGSPFFAIHSSPYQRVWGKVPSFTSAVATFYKMAPVTTGTIPAGNIWEYRWVHTPEIFRLNLGTSTRFVRPMATCDLAAGDVNRTIPLPPIKASALKDVAYTGATNFDLTANCTGATAVTYYFSGTPAPVNFGLFANTGTASGVGLWLYSRINGLVQTVTPAGADAWRQIPVSGNRAVLPLTAAYAKNGTVSGGTLVSTATINITYN